MDRFLGTIPGSRNGIDGMVRVSVLDVRGVRDFLSVTAVGVPNALERREIFRRREGEERRHSVLFNIGAG